MRDTGTACGEGSEGHWYSVWDTGTACGEGSEGHWDEHWDEHMLTINDLGRGKMQMITP